MSSIDPTSKLLAHIREHALAWQRQMPGRTGGAAPARARSSPGNTDDLLTQVAQAVVAISPDDPQGRRRAFRVYLGSVLGREFGVHLINDPGFDDLVGRVLDSMEVNPELRAAMDRAGDLLLQTARSSVSRPSR
ncbi:hypothetical protein [Cupriavidus sp. 8B]